MGVPQFKSTKHTGTCRGPGVEQHQHSAYRCIKIGWWDYRKAEDLLVQTILFCIAIPLESSEACVFVNQMVTRKVFGSTAEFFLLHSNTRIPRRRSWHGSTFSWHVSLATHGGLNIWKQDLSKIKIVSDWPRIWNRNFINGFFVYDNRGTPLTQWNHDALGHIILGEKKIYIKIKIFSNINLIFK